MLYSSTEERPVPCPYCGPFCSSRGSFRAMNSRTRRALFSATIFLAACGVTGSIIGGRVAAQSATDESTLRDSMKNFTDVYALVEQNYADKLNTDQVDKA